MDDELENEWPKLVKYYLHSSKESNRDIGNELELSEDAIEDKFLYTCYEVCVTLEVHEDGTTFITQVEEVNLEEKVEV